jgi:rhodanese-related sulfurtransferase
MIPSRLKALFSALLLIPALYCCAVPGENDNSNGNRLTPKAFQEAVINTPSGILVDVRSGDEFEQKGHLKGAYVIEWGANDFEIRLRNLDKLKPVFVYCQSGRRSGEAAAKMRELGFAKVFELDGGIEAWKKDNLPVEMKIGRE